MVTRFVATALGVIAVNCWANAVNAGQATTPVLERLDPPRRAVVIMALLGLVLTGVVLVTCVMLGAHWVRRLARHKPTGHRATGESRGVAERDRLRKSLEPMLPDSKTSDTVQLDTSTKETKVDP